MGSEWLESEKPALDQLQKMGYKYKTDRSLLHEDRESKSSVLLPDRFKDAIKKINPNLTNDDASEVLRLFRNFDTNSNFEINEIIHARLIGRSNDNLVPIVLERDWGDGIRYHTIKLIDFDNITNNDFLITNQFRLTGLKDEIIPDIIIFINGIPLAIIECKSPDIQDPINQAINNNLKRYQTNGRGYDSLFHYNQILVACSGTNAKYAPTFALSYQYRNWNDPYPLKKNEVNIKFGNERSQETLIAGLFDKQNFLSLIRDFIVYDGVEGRRIKKIAKYQQFRAVSKAIEKMKAGRSSIQRGGVIWHTQGSGKSLTMFWFAHQIRRLFENPTILIVTDRIHLDSQIHGTFNNCGFSNAVRASDKIDLKTQIANDRGKTIMTTIQKFLLPRNENSGPITNDVIYVLVDEGHRTQYGITAADMRDAMPNAVFFAYTGTPLLKSDKTRKVFGDYIDKYKLAESELDGTTLPIFYENRLSELVVDSHKNIDTMFDVLYKDHDEYIKALIRKKAVTPAVIAEIPKRIELIVKNIINDYNGRIKPNGYKAMIVASSKKSAVTYKEKLRHAGFNNCKIIMSKDSSDKNYGWDKYWLSKTDINKTLQQFKSSNNNSISILIVVDMLLTGFDAPILQVLYLDQKLTSHTLLQAIARVNRPYDEQKTRGFIVDYAGNANNLKDAFELYDDDDIKMLVKPFIMQIETLERRHKVIMKYFDGISRNDWSNILEIFTPIDIRIEFEENFKEFTKEMDAILPNPEALRFKDDLVFLSKVRIRVRNLFAESIDLVGYSEKIKKLIEENVKPINIVTIIDETKIDPNILKGVIKDSGGTNKTKASAIQRWVQKTIVENKDRDPEGYRRLSNILEKTILELKEKNYEDAAKFNELFAIVDLAYSWKNELEKLGFNDLRQFSTYHSLSANFDKKTSKIITFKIFDKTSALLKIIDYHKKENIQKNMRATVKDVLKDYGVREFEIRDKLAKEIIDAWVKNTQ